MCHGGGCRPKGGGGGWLASEIGRGGGGGPRSRNREGRGGSPDVKRVGGRGGSENFSCPPLPTLFNGIALMINKSSEIHGLISKYSKVPYWDTSA